MEDDIFPLLEKYGNDSYSTAKAFLETHTSQDHVDKLIDKTCSESYITDLPQSAVISHMEFTRFLFSLSDSIEHHHSKFVDTLNRLIQDSSFIVAAHISELLLAINQRNHDSLTFPVSQIAWKNLVCADIGVSNIHIVKILGNLLKSIVANSPDDMRDIFSKHLLNANAFILIPTLCNITSLVSNDEELSSFLFKSEQVWSSIIQCLNNPYDTAIRKKCIFLLHFMLDVNNKDVNEETKGMWLEIIPVLEILEETQGHIIKPILSRIPSIGNYVHDRKLSIKWIHVIFNRLLYQESKMISRWGMQLLMELDQEIFLQDNNMDAFENLLFTHISRTYMFYRPNFLSKGSCPPVVNQLRQYLGSLFVKMSLEQSQCFLLKILRFLEKPKLGSTPLIMVSYILSETTLSFDLDCGIITAITNINRQIIPTQSHIVKGCVQGFFLKFITNNVTPSPEILQSLQLYFSSLWLQYILDKDHPLWIQVANFVNKCSSLDIDAHITYLLNQLKFSDEQSSNPNVQGIGLVLAMQDSSNLARMNTVSTSLINVMESCGSNLYISANKVFSTAQVLNIIIQFCNCNQDNSIVEALIGNETIVDSVSLFLTRYLEEFCAKELLQQGNLDLKKLDRINNIAKLLISVIQYSDKPNQSVFTLLRNKMHSVSDRDVELPTLMFCAALVKAINISDIKHEGIRIINDEIHWLTSQLCSSSLFILESAWLCYSYLVLSGSINDYVACELFECAVDNVQKMKDAEAIKPTFDLIIRITPQVLAHDPDIFCNSIRSLWVTLQDFLNSSVYWDLLAKFCDTIFNPIVMENGNCVCLVKEWLQKLEEISVEKENMFYQLTESVIKYKTSKMEKIPEYIQTFTNLTLFGVSQCREKQNTKDLVSFIVGLGSGYPVNSVYKVANKDAPLARVQLISFLYSILERYENDYLILPVFDDLMSTFDTFQKSALINSLTNRIRIRVWQAVLCLMPLLVELSSEKGLLFEKLLSSLKVDTQPSVRCFIECCICYVISRNPEFQKKLLDILKEFNTHSNSFLVSNMSILVHHTQYLHNISKLKSCELADSLSHVNVWACANNHNVRNFASACILQLAELYDVNNWEIPCQFVNQIKYLKESSDYRKFNKRITELNAYFSKFNISRDLCLVNIFHSLPQHFNILENECVEISDIINLKTDIPYPVESGNFHEIPRVTSDTEQADYLISFKDIQVSREIQKKITPWQIMASNLGIDFERSVTKKGELVVYASLIDKATNLGGLSRTGEIFGVKTMVVNNLEILNNKEFKSLSMTSEKWIDFEQVRYDDSENYFQDLKRNGYTIVGVEQTANSISLENFEFPKKSVLVLGREKDGIPVEYLDNLDVCIEIPQLGLIRSLNVHVSASIMIWEYSKQHMFGNETNKLLKDGA